jgi:hypothetical protein
MPSIHQGIATAVQTRLRALVDGGTYLQGIDKDSIRVRKIPSAQGFASDSSGQYQYPGVIISRLGRSYPPFGSATVDAQYEIVIALFDADNQQVEDDQADNFAEWIEEIEMEFIDAALTSADPAIECYTCEVNAARALSFSQWLNNLAVISTVLVFHTDKATGNA